MTAPLLPPLPSNPTPPVTLDVSNGGELCKTADVASIADWGPLGYGTEEPEVLH